MLPVLFAAVREIRFTASGITARSFSLAGGTVDMSTALARFGAAITH
jgi:hypothetical protein